MLPSRSEATQRTLTSALPHLVQPGMLSQRGAYAAPGAPIRRIAVFRVGCGTATAVLPGCSHDVVRARSFKSTRPCSPAATDGPSVEECRGRGCSVLVRPRRGAHSPGLAWLP